MSTATTPSDRQRERIRERLRKLGERRAQQERSEEKLTKDIQKALAAADGKLTVQEQAQLLQMHRTTLYRVYR